MLDAFGEICPDVRKRLNALVAAHNKLYNPSNAPWKVKRIALEPLAEVEEANAIALPLRELQSPDVKTSGRKLAFNSKVTLYLDQEGRLYVETTEDLVVSNKEPLLIIRGKYQTGNAADSLMQSKKNFVEYALSGDSVILPTVETDKPNDISKDPRTLNSFLAALEKQGHVRPLLRLHEISRLGLKRKCCFCLFLRTSRRKVEQIAQS